ncbi:hypothetical protein D3C78_1180150 [compost metagenome]
MKLLLPKPLDTLPADALSPLEEGLRGADAEQLRAQALARLKDLESRARAAMSTRTLPVRYRECAALLDASLAAQDVLAHGGRPESPMGASVRLF